MFILWKRSDTSRMLGMIVAHNATCGTYSGISSSSILRSSFTCILPYELFVSIRFCSLSFGVFMDLQKFRERLKEYRNRIGISQAELADGIYVNKSVLSELLNGRGTITSDLVHRIIHYLAEHEAIRGQSQVFELLRLTDSEEFSDADWEAPPLADLQIEPSRTATSYRRSQHETPLVPSNEAVTPTQDSEGAKNDDMRQIGPLVQAERSEEQNQNPIQSSGDFRINVTQSSSLQASYLSQRDRLELTYRQLITIAEARFNFIGTVEAVRKFGGEVAYNALPLAKQKWEEAEQVFQEDEVAQTLNLLDNNKVWHHYFTATAAFNKYHERTKNLVNKIVQVQSPFVHPNLNLNNLLAGERWQDDDPQTKKLYLEMEKEFNGMLRAMNRRLKL